MFDWKLLKEHSFSVPVISVGNLSTGGTGKTPHVEYLIRLLSKSSKIAMLSRGYKRRTKGFVLSKDDTRVVDIGDEPFQIHHKFPKINVAVDEKRAHGVRKLLGFRKPPNLIILDDAFQHRHVKPGISILLTDFYDLYSNDFVLPAGNLREFKCGAKRADIIIVTKSPRVLSPYTRKRVRDSIKPHENQNLFFSYLKHGKLSQIPGCEFEPAKSNDYSHILMLAGIANPYPLEDHLKKQCSGLTKITYPDHHAFTGEDLDDVIREFDNIYVKKKIIVTTEKDMMRLIQPDLLNKIRSLPICYIPVEVKIHKSDREAFNNQILNYVSKSSGNS